MLHEELRQVLAAHARRYPAMAPADGVKLIYQNEFGSGHLIADPAQSLDRLRAEFASVPRDPAAALAEDIGNGLVRIQLQGLDSESYPLEALDRDLIRSARLRRGSMDAFLEKLDVRAPPCAGWPRKGLSASRLGSWKRTWDLIWRPAVRRSPTARDIERRTGPLTGWCSVRSASL